MATKNKALTEDQKREVRQIVRKQFIVGFLTFLALLGGITGLSLWDIKKHIENKVEDLVAKQFEEPRIKEIVEDAAKNRATVLMSEQIDPEVLKFKEDIALKITKAEGKLSEIDDKIRDANETVGKLAKLSYVFLIADIAKSGSKQAYLELKKLAAKEGTEESIIAKDNLEEINRDLRQYRRVSHQPKLARMEIYRDVNDGNSVCIQDDSIDILTIRLIISPDNERHVLMEYIEKKPKEEIFKTALKVFESDSLPACAIFCGVLFEISDEKADFLDFDKWTEICKKQINKK